MNSKIAVGNEITRGEKWTLPHEMEFRGMNDSKLGNKRTIMAFQTFCRPGMRVLCHENWIVDRGNVLKWIDEIFNAK